ncbi:MAG: Fur family transcriptional regulator [Acidimicrobiales bacterium]
MPEDLHAAIASRLADEGQRYTSGRQLLIEVLDSSPRPLTAAEVLVQAPLAQSSAYRNLAVLEACGVVHRVAGSDEFARYELAEDLTEHHHHLICTSCGRVDDFTVSDPIEVSLDAVAAQVASRTGFRTDHHRLDLFGRCEGCAGTSP